MTYLDYFFHQSLVGARLGSLQAADALPDPRDQSKLDPLAHGIASGESHKAKQPDVICAGTRKGGGTEGHDVEGIKPGATKELDAKC